MATLEDKILGEKRHNYCSSSEDSEKENSDCEETCVQKQKVTAGPLEINKWEGSSSNTGPKGVITDWQKYVEHEKEKKKSEVKEKIELSKKLTLTVQTALDEEREKAKLEDPDLAELLNDDFLVSYQKQRMQDMLKQTNYQVKFGELQFLKNGQEFLDAIDQEHKSVTVIIHIYEDNVEACCTMNACLKYLCKIHDNVKFCSIKSSNAGTSKQFKTEGLPALLIYKNGNLVGNFVKISNELGNDFTSEDVQEYLVECGLLEDKTCKPELIRNCGHSSDSD